MLKLSVRARLIHPATSTSFFLKVNERAARHEYLVCVLAFLKASQAQAQA